MTQWPGTVVEEWPGQAVTKEQVAEKTTLGSQSSMTEAALRGATQGITFGLNDEVSGLQAAGGGILPHNLIGGAVRMGAEYLAPGVFGSGATDRYTASRDQMRAGNKAAQAEYPMTYGASQIAGGVGTGLGLVRSGASLAGNAIQGGSGLGRVTAMSGLEGAGLGAVQGFGAGEGLRDSAMQAGGGALAGGGVGLAAPAIVSGVTAGVRRAAAPFGTTPERQAAAQVLRNEGVDLTAGQVTGSRGLRYAEGEIGGARAASIGERQGEQFTAAALRRSGETATRATPEVLDKAFTRIGQQFDDLAVRNTMRPDQQFVQDFHAAVRDYGAMVPPSQRAPFVEKIGGDIIDALRGGRPMAGDVYQSISSQLARAARGAGNNPELRTALYGMRDALDGAMERSIASVNPTDAGLWREARNQYRNLLTIERAATGAGENAALGLISPSALRNATVSTQGRRSYARGSGDFAELARAGEALMKPLPDSGTASRTAVRALGTSVPAVVGALAGTGAGPAGTLAGMAAGAAIPKVAGALMMTGPVQNYLMRNAGAVTPQQRAVINALLLGGGTTAGTRALAP
jgi:hypothetical protein